MSVEQKIIGSGIMFLLTIVIGFWLSTSGKPYNTAIFTIHKLIALTAVVLTSILIFNLLKSININAGIVILILVAIISIVALFSSGALLSTGNVSYTLVKTIHIVASILAVISTGLLIYFILRK